MAAASSPHVIAVCVSKGGIPKVPQEAGYATTAGLAGDGHNHAKHIRANRAICLFDLEILQQLVQEGFALEPGVAGENLTVAGLHVQKLSPGTLLAIGDAVLKLEEPRKPCYVLDAIDPRLKDTITGRCGYMASVVSEGHVARGATIHIIGPDVATAKTGIEHLANQSDTKAA